MNRLREPRAEDGGGSHRATHGEGALAPIDPQRRALELRIEHAKSRIVEDLNRASAQVREVAAQAWRRLGTLVVASGVVLAGIVVGALLRRSRRRARIHWR